VELLNILFLTSEPFDLWSKIAEQGFNLLLLAIAVYWMNNKNKILEGKIELQQAKIEDLHKEMLEYERKDNQELMNVLRENTLAFKTISEVIEKFLLTNNNT